MSNDSALFEQNTFEGALPLYEAKQFQLYDHRWATFDKSLADFRDCTELEHSDPEFAVNPRYWIRGSEVVQRVSTDRKWMLAFRSISNSANARFFVTSILPLAGLGNSASLIWCAETATRTALLYGMLSSLTFEFVVRQKVSGTNLNFFIVNQLPLIPIESIELADIGLIVPRILELTYTATSLESFYTDLVAENRDWDKRTSGERGEPWQWDPLRRAVLRAELDALYARLYGLTRDELRYVLDPAEVMGSDHPSETFRVLKDKEVRQLGEYRTQRLVLEAWDRMESGQLL